LSRMTHSETRPVPDDLRHLGRRRHVAVAPGADDAVDDGHADAGEVALLNAVEDVLAGGMLRRVASLRSPPEIVRAVTA
jgi:hypothetical protein